MLAEGVNEADEAADGGAEGVGELAVKKVEGAEGAAAPVLEGPVETGTRTGMVVGTATLFLAVESVLELDSEPEPEEAAAAAEPEPAVAEPVEVTAEVVCEMEVAPDQMVGPGSW